MGKTELSLRLKCIADMVTPGTCIYDVGCDHGFLSIYLTENEIADSAVALDVVEGPLQAAKQHVTQAGLDEKIECRLSNGLHNITAAELKKLKHKTLVMAGMGGPLIINILTECPQIRDEFDEIIAGPQSRIEDFRAQASDMGLEITDENMVFEDGKFYQLIKMNKNKGKRSDPSVTEDMETIAQRAENRYGSILLKKKDPVLKQYLEYEYGVIEQVLNSLDADTHSDRYRQVCDDKLVNRLAYDQFSE